ncbi:biotin transporter BioY [Kineococcus sp. SYSU DK003]|uniref:biotin transporter BioY n=1 Tax=Kineococcus sp. SYSU DK003 TaxID=3383124 RepID=UPI003D7C576B
MTSSTRPRTAVGIRRPADRSRDLALVAVFAALVSALALTPGIPVGGVGVPITLQTLGIMLCGAVLGPWRGAVAAALYLLVGFLGIPVFANGNAGLGVLAGMSAGYLISYPAAAFVTGWLTRAGARRGRTVLGLVLGVVLGGVVLVHVAGTVGMAIAGNLPPATAVKFDLPFLPGDALKAVLAVLVAVPVHRAFPRLLRR